ncbi:expressed protein [Echinococcus multilocularis]|uniref:Expressed protein n=1 Tax=Echinococcus multilocularis TaxID=6211 RepID=A0A068YB90_ECHMU|nr:expressed protein [Echinococcus multilocularis]
MINFDHPLPSTSDVFLKTTAAIATVFSSSVSDDWFHTILQLFPPPPPPPRAPSVNENAKPELLPNSLLPKTYPYCNHSKPTTQKHRRGGMHIYIHIQRMQSPVCVCEHVLVYSQ